MVNKLRKSHSHPRLSSARTLPFSFPSLPHTQADKQASAISIDNVNIIKLYPKQYSLEVRKGVEKKRKTNRRTKATTSFDICLIRIRQIITCFLDSLRALDADRLRNIGWMCIYAFCSIRDPSILRPGCP